MWTRLAEARSVAGRPDAALEAACEATRLFPGGLEARAERACARSALGDVEGAAETLAAWLATDRVAVHKGAAEGLVELDADRARGLLEKATAGSAATALARAAGLSTDRRFVRPLIRLLRCDDPALRRAARDSLFGLVGEAAPRLATLDTSDANSADYRRDVLEIGAWWARQGEE